MRHPVKLFCAVGISLLVAMFTACGGSGATQGSLSVVPAKTVVEPGPASMPAFPGESHPETEKVVMDANVLAGLDAWQRSATGAEINGPALDLTSTTTSIAWGMWAWGTFTEGLLPQKLETSITPVDNSEYWILFTNYDADRWLATGPYTGSDEEYTYDESIGYISSLGYTHVVVVVEGGNSVSVNHLNLVTDRDVIPPDAPKGIRAINVNATYLTVDWQANNESDLSGYRVYRGPAEDFSLADPGVVELAELEILFTDYGHSNLTPLTTYHYRVTAFDKVGNESVPTPCLTVTTPEEFFADPPSNLQVETVGSSYADISWNQPPQGIPLGYEVYLGPETDFEIGEPGVVRVSPGLVNNESWRIPDLLSQETYFCRVRAYYLNFWTGLSNTVEFTTPLSVPPVPNFVYSPDPVQVDLITQFNPATTTDEDTPVETLTFYWDFENDGVDDLTTTGPEIVYHTYPERGENTVKLTVSDGQLVSITKTFEVTLRYDLFDTVRSLGMPQKVLSVDQDLSNSLIGVITKNTQDIVVRTFDADISNWTEKGFDLNPMVHDIVIDAAGSTIVVAEPFGATCYWKLYSDSSGNWVDGKTESVARDAVGTCRFDISPAGRVSVIMVAGTVGDKTVSYFVYGWHEKADGTYTTYNESIGLDYVPPCDVKRTDTESYFAYSYDGNIHYWTMTDSTDTQSNIQAINGTGVAMSMDVDPLDPSHVYWALATDTNRVYYGDNYGAANGAGQYITLANTAMDVVGAGHVGDNEGYFFYTDIDADEVEQLHGYDSTANGGAGETYDFLSGLGAATSGAGVYFEDNSEAGVFSIVDETRDGEVLGRFMVDGAINYTEVIYKPDSIASTSTSHQLVTFADGGILAISGQPFPTCRTAYSAVAGDPFTLDIAGEDNSSTAKAACGSSVPNEYFVGGNTGTNRYVINRFNYGSQTGTEVLSMTGINLLRMGYNEASGQSLMCYVEGGDRDIVVRTWDGASWSAPTTIHSNAAVIECLTIAPNSDGDWGVAFYDTLRNLGLIESSGPTWGAVQSLSTTELSANAGIGLDYHADGHLAVTVERKAGTTGVYLGVRPDGGSLAWNHIYDTHGSATGSMSVFYETDNPTVLFLMFAAPMHYSKIHLLDFVDSDWRDTELPFQLIGVPLATAVDASGNIVLAGYRYSSVYNKAYVAIIY